jgi:ElaB/YqjD/DUF883 family membrane-anchored ribosome-binding protein
MSSASSNFGNRQQDLRSTADDAREGVQAAATSVLEQTREAATSVLHRAEEMAQSAAGQASEMAGNVSRRASQAASSVAGTVESSVDYVRRQGFSGMMADVTLLVRRNPVPALLIGFGIGFLIARAMRD